MIFGITTNKGGQCMAFPDVCKTPSPGGPIPIPYMNVVMMNQAKASSCSSKVLIENKKTCTKKTEVPMSSGDEAGSAGGGVVSSKIKGEATFNKKFSSKVKAEGQNVIFHTCISSQNGKSANMPAGTHVSPSQGKVKVMM